MAKMDLGIKVLVFSGFFYFLSNCRGDFTNLNVFETIDIESNIKNFSELSLSQFNAEINYIPLKNDNNQEISWIDHLDFNSDFLLVSNTNACLLYDYNGTIIKKIGGKGRGPDEFVTISNAGFGFNKNIYIQSLGNFLEFKTDGTFVSSFDIKKGKDPSFYMLSWVSINDSLFLGQIPLSTGLEKNKAFLFDIHGNTKYEFKNYIFLNRISLVFSSNDFQTSFYTYKSKIHFKEKMNDTLFWVNDKYELSPILSFKIGKYSMPNEYREKIDIQGYNPFNYVYVNNVFEISDFFILDCDFGKYTPARRIFPREVMGQQIWYNTANVLGIYNKESKSLVFCKPTATDNPLFTTGFNNDIDAGPRFYPMKQVNDSTLAMWVTAKELKDHVASDDFKINVPKYREKKKKLEDLTNKLTEFDNPVLMFVTFNNK